MCYMRNCIRNYVDNLESVFFLSPDVNEKHLLVARGFSFSNEFPVWVLLTGYVIIRGLDESVTRRWECKWKLLRGYFFAESVILKIREGE